jgi:hypothetical protein
MRIKKLVSVFAALAIALTTAVISIPSASASSSGDAQFAQRLYALINDYRAQHALAPLRWNDQMAAESQSWTQQSADLANIHGAGAFRHSPGSYAFHENIVWNMNADEAFTWWVNSPAHRANMLGAADTDIGLGAVQLTAGPNRGAYLATAKFGQYAVSPEEEAAAREAAARAAAEKAAQEAAARAAAEEAAAQVAAEKAAQEAAAEKAAQEAAAQEAAVEKAAQEAAARAAAEEAAAQEAAAEKAAQEAAAQEAAAEMAAQEAAARAAAEEAAAQEAAAEKAAQETAAQAAADKAAQEAAAEKAAQEAAAQEAEVEKAAQEAAARAAAEEAAAEKAAQEVAAEKAAQEAAAQEAAAEKAAQEVAAQEAAAEKAAQDAAAQDAAADAAAKAAAEKDAQLAAEQAEARASVPVATVEEVVSGRDPLLTASTQGNVTAVASGSRLRISGLEAGAAYDVVISSAGVSLGTHTADAGGSLAAGVPAVLAAGEHKVALFRDGALAGWSTFSVEQAVTVLAAQQGPAAADGTVELAATGLNAAELAIGGIGTLMALTGAGALAVVQRQRQTAARR